MNNAARPWIGLVFKCLSVLALIFTFVFFMRMQEEQSENDKLRNQGVVSRALVKDKQQDEMVTRHSSGRRNRSSFTTKTDLWVLHVRHVPQSTVRYADFPSRVNEADLPVAPGKTGDVSKDMAYGGVVWVSHELYDRTRVGDMFAVVNTPWDRGSPVPVSEVEAFDPSPFYPKIAVSLLLVLAFWLIGRRIGKLPVAQGVARAGGANT